jgi:hypothetical protein
MPIFSLIHFVLELILKSGSMSQSAGGKRMFKSTMKIAGMAILCLGLGVTAYGKKKDVPEIDPKTGLEALALVAGALLVIRSRPR